MRKNYRRCVCYLIVIELAEVFHIHFAFTRIGNSGKAVKLRVRRVNLLHSLDNIRKLTHSRGLDNYSIGLILVKHLFKRLRKISDKRAADTSRVHLGYLNTRILKESAVNTDLSEFILNQNDLFSIISLF